MKQRRTSRVKYKVGIKEPDLRVERNHSSLNRLDLSDYIDLGQLRVRYNYSIN